MSSVSTPTINHKPKNNKMNKEKIKIKTNRKMYTHNQYRKYIKYEQLQ